MNKLFWMAFLSLSKLKEASMSRNVEILVDLPPILKRINDTFSYLEYKNSVKIQNFTNIKEIKLYARHLIFDDVNGRVSKNLDKTSNYNKVVEEKTLRDEGKVLTSLSTCKKYEKLELRFISDSGNDTVLNFKYDPFTSMKQNIDDWICVVNETVVKVSLKNSKNHFVIACIRVLDLSNYSFYQLKNGYNKVGEIKDSKLEMQFHESDSYSYFQLKSCSETMDGDDFFHNLFFILGIFIIGIILATLVFTVIIYKRKKKLTTVKINGKIMKKEDVMSLPEFSLHSDKSNSGVYRTDSF